MRILQQTASPTALIPKVYVEQHVNLANPVVPAVKEEGDVPVESIDSSLKEENLRSVRLCRYLSSYIDPIDLKVYYCHEYEGDIVRIWARGGRVIVREWSLKGREIFRLLPIQEGFCFSFTFQLAAIIHKRISIVIFGFRQPLNWTTFTARYNLTVSSLILFDSAAYAAAQQGNWIILRQLLEKGNLRLSDKTENGDTLLHVCNCIYSHHSKRVTWGADCCARRA